MAKRKLLILEQADSDWCDFLTEFFEDMPVDLEIVHNTKDFNTSFSKKTPDLVFVNQELLNVPVIQKLKALKQSAPHFRCFGLNQTSSEMSLDAQFESPDSLRTFRKQLVSYLPLPEKVRVLIVDDEPEIGGALRDYLEGRSNPVFEVEYVENGKLGLEVITRQTPDVLILDIKMPVMSGQEVYAQVKQKNLDLAVIVFFDAISGNEVTELHKHGRPVIVDKGSDQSAMPEMMALIKKMAYFYA